MSLNVKRVQRFITLYEEYDEARREWLLAKLTAEDPTCAEVQELEARVKTLVDQAVKQFNVSPLFFGTVGRQVKAMAESPWYW